MPYRGEIDQISRNFERDVLGSADPDALALIELDGSGGRTDHTFAQLRAKAAGLAGTLAAQGLKRGDVVLTLAGNRHEWVCAMLAAFRSGFVAMPCNEQLRAKDLEHRLATVPVAAIVAAERNRDVIADANPSVPVLWIGDEDIWAGEAPKHVDLSPTDPAVLIFTSGTSGHPKCAVHGQRYLWGQDLQARHWVGFKEGDIAWCTAAPGWSKSARNTFLAPWLAGATPLLHDARFDPNERVDVIEQLGVNVLCMAPTEYRAIVNHGTPRPIASLRTCMAAGEALDIQVLRAWQEATGVEIRDGYGQTETGPVTGMPIGEVVRPGSMGKPLPNVKAWIENDELVVDPTTLPTFFLGYWGAEEPSGPWRTGDRVREDEDGYLYFVGRADDLIVSAGYRIGPFEVEAALLEHPAVAEVACVAHPDVERGSIVRAVIVLRSGFEPGTGLVEELQSHVKTVTAPYKYPRLIEFVEELPKTTSGKIRRAALRAGA